MELSVKEAAIMLGVNEGTVRDWVSSGSIPSYRIRDKIRLNRVELMEWAASRDQLLHPHSFQAGSVLSKLVLSAAVVRGGLLTGIQCEDKLSALGEVSRLMPLPAGVDREDLKNVLIARETLCSTGIGNGVAIPHPRGPIVLGVSEPQVTIAFPEHPLDFGALDGQPVHTLFVIVSTTVKVHLILLSHLMYALNDPGFKRLLLPSSGLDRLVGGLREIEATIPDRDA